MQVHVICGLRSAVGASSPAIRSRAGSPRAKSANLLAPRPGPPAALRHPEPSETRKGISAMHNLSFSDLPSIDLNNLDAIVGGEGWGEWIGKYAGATIGGGLGALGGTAAGTAVGGPVGGVVGGGAGGAVGGAAGYDLGGRFGKWVTGGR
jgi:hypothetical protein